MDAIRSEDARPARGAQEFTVGVANPPPVLNWAEKIAIAKQARQAGAYMRRKETRP